MKTKAGYLVGMLVASAVASAPAAIISFSEMVGDDDGYGMGVGVVPDNATGVVWPGSGISGSGYDGRDAGEASATNGAQYTDVYSSLFAGSGGQSGGAGGGEGEGVGPNPNMGMVMFPLPGTLLTGVLTVDMGDFQATAFNRVMVKFNGVAQDWGFDDGYQNTVVRTFNLSPEAVDAANAEGKLVVTIDRDGATDFIAFDYFKLDGRARVPDNGSALCLMGGALLGVAAARRRLAARRRRR